MDFAAAARLSGARFVVLKGALARLERALELAGAERFPQVFLQAGSPLRDLLARQVRQGTRHRGLVEELRITLDRRAGAWSARSRS